MKPADIRNMTKDEIIIKVTYLKEELFKLRHEKVGGRIEHPEKLATTRRDIARCLTILKEIERGEKK